MSSTPEHVRMLFPARLVKTNGVQDPAIRPLITDLQGTALPSLHDGTAVTPDCW